MSVNVSNNLPLYRRTAIIGTGLIGGSLGIRLRERHLVGEVIGSDRDISSLEAACERGAVDECASSPLEAVKGADLVILAVPVLSTEAVIKEIAPALTPGIVVTDVGSTKKIVMETARKHIPPGVWFIGGHPMAGSEESGIKGADPALLENAIYVLTPDSQAPPGVTERLFRLIEMAGAQPILLKADRHDSLAALVSHLPHMAAAALVESAALAGEDELVRTLAAGGFRDTTRVALGNPEIWRDICISNRAALAGVIKNFSDSLASLRHMLEQGDTDALEQYFIHTREFRRSVPHRGRGILPDIFELVVLVPDTPGVIGRLAGLLGEAGINISSIEILHVRELAGGSILIGFREEKQRQEALELLKRKGYRAHLKE